MLASLACSFTRFFCVAPQIRLKKPRGRPRVALPRATPCTGTTRVKCFATSPLALCARCVLARTPPRSFPRARGRLGFVATDEPAIVSYATQSGRFPLIPRPSPRGSADPNARAPPPRTPQTRALHTSARAFAADAPAVSLDDTAEAWATVKAAVATEDGQRAIAQLQKTMGDIRDEVGRDAKPVAPIDWAALKAKSGFPAIVDQFKAGLEGVKYPAYDGNEVEETKATFKTLVAEAEKMVAAAAKREAEIDAELASIAEDKKKLATITMDEVFEKEPELKKEVDERIRNDQWF